MNNPFKYEVGMFGGCFDVPHIGHMAVILRAAAECHELNLVLSYSKKRDSVDYRIRYGWLKQMTAHLNNVKIIPLADDCATKEEYNTDSHWDEGAAIVKKEIGKKIDAIYCSNEYDTPDCPYKRLYPESEMVFVDRSEIPCSSTEIRKNPYEKWEYLPKCVRKYFTKRVLIIGNESTGKTTLAKSLALAFNTECVTEYGRDVCERCGGEDGMTENEFLEILAGHKTRVDDMTKTANRVLFVDTDALTTSYYASMNRSVPKDSMLFDMEAMKAFSGKWDLVFFMESDVPYVHDGVRIDARNEEAARKAKTDELKKIYSDAGYGIISISGNYYERFSKCVNIVTEELYGNKNNESN